MDMDRVEKEAKIFDGIVGNHPALRLLENALSSGVSHAYLFHGPRGVGKRSVAYRFGAALVSGGDEGAMSRALRGLHPDLVEVVPEGKFTAIGQVREMMRLAASRPFEGARRVFVLQADTLNVQAANALLKTLEEPEGENVFVLIAASREGVLPTILSRAQEVRFDPLPPGEVVPFLAKRGCSEGEAKTAAALGRGKHRALAALRGGGRAQEAAEAVLGAGSPRCIFRGAARGGRGDHGSRRERGRGAGESVSTRRGRTTPTGERTGAGRKRRSGFGRAARDEAVAELWISWRSSIGTRRWSRRGR
jgi:DNA polymerase-3 subunit delta'